MNIQILPYAFKRIGLFLFFLSLINPSTIGAWDAITGVPCEDCANWQKPSWVNITELASLLGFILYFLSKEKVEDELIKQIRLEAMSMAFISSIFVLLFIHLMNFYSLQELGAGVIFYLHMFLFLIIYHALKMNFDL